MQYSLGIDAGGTYTDAVLIRDSDGSIIDSNKSLTTYPDILTGIRNTLDGLDQQYLEKVHYVSVSTTLATNSVLERTGYPVALILANGTDIPNSAKIEHFTLVKGGHNSAGNEVCPLDLEPVKEFVLRVKDKVSAFAISSYFSVRNPDHELRIKEVINELTGLPVVCGHELSQDLGAYERGVTAYLNARLIPISSHFMEAVSSELKRRNIDAKLMMLKCDGSVVGINEALKRPIESVFSGPAASLVGAAHLSGNENCTVIDVGGTSTDVSLIYRGLPELSEAGAVVGGWQTKVKAIRMETSAMGGDSHVWVRNHVINIGPRRVIPLCLAAVEYPEIIEKLKQNQVILRNQIGENLQPTKFFIRSGLETTDISSAEEELLSRIGDRPLTVSEIYWNENRLPNPGTLDLLIQKRLIKAIGFTPTDALHVLGEYTQWNREASVLGAGILAALSGTDEDELCLQIKKDVARNMALNLIAFLLEDVSREEIEKVLKRKFFAGFKVDLPVVLLGGPVRAYAEELAEFIDAEIIVPEHCSVGNAVGAVAGKGARKLEVLIKANYTESKYNLKTSSFVTFFPGGREEFASYQEALEFGEEIGSKLIMNYMSDAGLDSTEVSIDMLRNDIVTHEGGLPVETRLTFSGIGEAERNRKMEVE
ncbi:hydantoinase/oxoprolinase N-terminal domain-containing protein [Methanolobus profundi]|uniref:N-methylhydantoinase A/oxoprolinase/acetone carboxylase, beta subunit n=1 Tax=Methanolobus profundi TaxID=487685 RepID=A0A1I4T3L6_9EURY|nr:hydantoinase/oxoprolinase family protein [Methanolobus profundi]SFM71140.1 N-methylhydantoinase A/oxoprolinase/acetone carboxylase, beta subunit [Methanolobus profundi]